MNEFHTRIYVAGYGGMVGSAIVRCLAGKGCINILSRSHADLDLTDQAQVRASLQKQRRNEVYVAAARGGGIDANNGYPAEFIYSNLIVEANLIHDAWRTGVSKLLFLGSSCIYSKMAAQPMSEDTLLTGNLEPTNELNAITKIAGGIKLCESYNWQYGCDFRSVMHINLYGSGDNYYPRTSHVLPAMIRRFHETKVVGARYVLMWGTGSPKREFQHVGGMASACIHVMDLLREVYADNTDVMNSHINAGTGEGLSIAELAQLVSDMGCYQDSIISDPNKLDGTPRKLQDVSKVHRLGWKNMALLRNRIEEAYNDFLRSEVRARQAVAIGWFVPT